MTKKILIAEDDEDIVGLLWLYSKPKQTFCRNFSILKFIYKCNNQECSLKKNKCRNNDTIDLKTFYTAVVIKIYGYWSKYRQIDQ